MKYNCRQCKKINGQSLISGLDSVDAVEDEMEPPSITNPGVTGYDQDLIQGGPSSVHVPLIEPPSITEPADITHELSDPSVKKKADKKRPRCSHGREQYRCAECGGNGICQHKKKKECCIICNGCIHGKHKFRCTECDGRHVCIHGRNKNSCKQCKAAREQGST